jgi:hypothetical protein
MNKKKFKQTAQLLKQKIIESKIQRPKRKFSFDSNQATASKEVLEDEKCNQEYCWPSWL